MTLLRTPSYDIWDKSSIAPEPVKAQECAKSQRQPLRLLSSLVLVGLASMIALHELQASAYMQPVAAASGMLLFLYGYCEGRSDRQGK